jgi:tetratricopeptide (TPR) repeat protein
MTRSLSPVRTTALSVATIVVTVVAAYSNSLHVPFLFDDTPAVVENRTLRQLSLVWPVLLYPPASGNTVQGRPVLNLSFAGNYSLGGLDVVGYHVVNLAVHIAAALVLFGLTRRVLGLPGCPDWLSGRATGLALATALLWALHPLQTESVTYIAQRAESLGGLWYLLTFYCTVRGAGSSRGAAWYAAAVLACALGAASKETIATAPLLLAVFDRVYLSPSWRQVFRARGRLYVGLAASWVLLAVLIASSSGRGGTVGGISPFAYACTQFGYIARYLYLTVWPADLVFDYGVLIARSPDEIIPPALLIAALIGLTGLTLWRCPRVGFLGLAFFTLLAPTSTVVPINTQTGAEHRMYLALAPLAALVVIAVAAAREAIAARHPSRRQRAADLVLATVVFGGCALLGWRTYTRNSDYQTPERIWTDTVAKYPRNFRGYLVLGTLARDQGRSDEALDWCEKALTVCRNTDTPSYRVLVVRADVFQKAGRLDAAERAFDEAAALDPGPLVLIERGRFFLDTNRPAAALSDFTTALARDPENETLYRARASAQALLGRLDESKADFDHAIELDPYDPICRLGRANFFLNTGRLRLAADDFNEAIRLDEAQPDGYLGRAQVAISEQRYADAAADVDRAERLNGKPAEVFYFRGVLAWSRRDPLEAATHLSKAIKHNPTFLVAYQLRASCYVALGDMTRARADVAELKRLGGTPSPGVLRALAAAGK